jgi:acetyltransferase-like isoleucine patch superfamily enzyme
MPLQIVDNGENNQIDIAPDTLAQLNGRLELSGTGNRVSIAAPYACGNILLLIGGGSTLTIAAECMLGDLFVYACNRGNIRVGFNSKFNGHVRLMAHEPGSIAIGDGCLIAGGTEISVSDMHSIVSIDSGLRVNPPRNVTVGNRVWIGAHALILKGTAIGNGSIVGANAVVTRDVPENCAAAGNPARVVKDRVTWREDLI